MAKFKSHVLSSNEKSISRYVAFCVFLLQICQRDAAPMFKWLQNAFKQDLNNSPSWAPHLTKIGKLYFGIKPPPSKWLE